MTGNYGRFYNEIKNKKEAQTMELKQAIFDRRSIRRYQEKEVTGGHRSNKMLNSTKVL